MKDLSDNQLVEMVTGKPEKARAVFFEKAVLDTITSKRKGHRIYEQSIYVLLKQAGVSDSISYKATLKDQTTYKEEYEYFLSTRQGARKTVSIEIIPGLDIAHMQELLDYGISTVEQLATVDQVPDHLIYAQQSAITLNTVLQEQRNGQHEKGSVPEGSEVSEEPSPIMPQANRSKYPTSQREPDLPPGPIVRNDEVAEEHAEGGQQHHSQDQLSLPPKSGVNMVDNWKVEMVWSDK
jgi:hypothetical protein